MAESSSVAAIDTVLDKLSSCRPAKPGQEKAAKSELACVASEDRSIKVSEKYRVDAKAEMAQIECALERAIHRWSSNSAKDAQDALDGKVPDRIKNMTLAQKVGEFQKLYNSTARQKQLSDLSGLHGLSEEFAAVDHNLKVDRLPGIKTLCALKLVTELFDAQVAKEKGVATPVKEKSATESPVEKTSPKTPVEVTPVPVVTPKLLETVTDSKGHKFELGISKEEAVAFENKKNELAKEGFQIEFGTNPNAAKLKTISLLTNDGKQKIGTADIAEPLAVGQITATIKNLVDIHKAKEEVRKAAEANRVLAEKAREEARAEAERAKPPVAKPVEAALPADAKPVAQIAPDPDAVVQFAVTLSNGRKSALKMPASVATELSKIQAGVDGELIFDLTAKWVKYKGVPYKLPSGNRTWANLIQELKDAP